MKIILTLLILGSTYQLFADFESAIIYKNDGGTIHCHIKVYQPGVLVGNVDSLYYKIDQHVFGLALGQIAGVEMNNEKYEVLILKESSENYFDEELILEYSVLAKVLERGEVGLYQYYYTGNSVFANGANHNIFGKRLHNRPLISKNGEVAVIYKLNYCSSIRAFFPDCASEVLAGGFKYDQIKAAIVTGNRYLAAK